jgi:hypothetical protein
MFGEPTSPGADHPDKSILRSHPCEAGKPAHGYPRTALTVSMDKATPGGRQTGETEAEVVVAVGRLPVVAVGGTHPGRVVVPRAAAHHALARPADSRLNKMPEKIVSRKPCVLAWRA